MGVSIANKTWAGWASNPYLLISGQDAKPNTTSAVWTHIALLSFYLWCAAHLCHIDLRTYLIYTMACDGQRMVYEFYPQVWHQFVKSRESGSLVMGDPRKTWFGSTVGGCVSPRFVNVKDIYTGTSPLLARVKVALSPSKHAVRP